MVRHLTIRTFRLIAASALLLGLVALSAHRAQAQSIGIEAGASTVESFDGPRPTLGLSLFLPLTERLRLAVTGTQWSGCPVEDCDAPRSGFGNRGLNVVGLFDLIADRHTGASVGAGIGWFEMKELTEGGTATETSYDEAFTFAAELRRAVAYNSGVYLRGETSFPTDGGDGQWSSLRLGVDVRVF